MMQQKLVDAFKMLGLPENASEKDIRDAYRHLAKEYHPDSATEHADAQKFALITAAYKIALDSKKNPLNYSIYNQNNSTSKENRAYSIKRRREEELKMRMERAKQLAKERKERLEAVQLQAFQATRKPLLKYGHLFTFFLCMLLFSLLIVDYFSPQIKRETPIEGFFGLYESGDFDHTTLVSFSDGEKLYVDYRIILNTTIQTEYRHLKSELTETKYLHFPNELTVYFNDKYAKTFPVDYPPYTMIPLILIFLGISLIFYVYKPKNLTNYVFMFYATWGIPALGIFAVLVNGSAPKIFHFLLGTN